MKKIISAVVIAGALSQIANAMGPTGDMTHRHFYKDQEWIWQNEASRAKDETGMNRQQSFNPTHVWSLPVAVAPVAFELASNLPAASVFPTKPPGGN
jgi:hypothetical protein